MLRRADQQFYEWLRPRPEGVEYVLLAAEAEAAAMQRALDAYRRFVRAQAEEAWLGEPRASHARFWADRGACLAAWERRLYIQLRHGIAAWAPHWLLAGATPPAAGWTAMQRADRARWRRCWRLRKKGRAALERQVARVIQERERVAWERGRPLRAIRTGENMRGGVSEPWWRWYWDAEEKENRRLDEERDEDEEEWDPEAYA